MTSSTTELFCLLSGVLVCISGGTPTYSLLLLLVIDEQGQITEGLRESVPQMQHTVASQQLCICHFLYNGFKRHTVQRSSQPVGYNLG